MKKYLAQIQKNPLFDGISDEGFETMLACLTARVKSFSKNGVISMEGEAASQVGIVAEGSAQIIKEDILGNRNIIAHINAGELFGEAFACAGVGKMPVTVMAGTSCTVVFIDYKKVISTCSNSCIFHQRLLENMLGILARKNILLNNKIAHISKRTIREKVMSYLVWQAQEAGSTDFRIPFNRQGLADYLCTDRSALSNELGKLRDEGVIEFNRDEFKLLGDMQREE